MGYFWHPQSNRNTFETQRFALRLHCLLFAHQEACVKGELADQCTVGSDRLQFAQQVYPALPEGPLLLLPLSSVKG